MCKRIVKYIYFCAKLDISSVPKGLGRIVRYYKPELPDSIVEMYVAL